MKTKTTKLFFRTFALATITLVGCTSLIIKSTLHREPAPGDGLSYCLPKGWLKISLTRAAITAKYTDATDPDSIVSETTMIPLSYNLDVVLAPDSHERYLLSPQLSACADDFVQLKVTNSLLESVSLTNSDQTLGILSNLVETAIGALQAAYSLPKADLVLKTVVTNYYVTNVFLIDPFEEARNGNQYKVTDHVLLDLKEFKMDADAYATRPLEPTKPDQCCKEIRPVRSPKDAGQPDGAVWKHSEDFSGIYYRPLEAYKVGLDFEKYGSFQTLVYLPNKSQTLRLSAERAAFVKQSINIVFSQGIPQVVTINKPSQALAATTLPLTMLKSLTSLPTNLVQFRINLGSGGGSSSNSAASTNSLVTVQQSNTVTSNTIQVLQQPAASSPGQQKPSGTNSPPPTPKK